MAEDVVLLVGPGSPITLVVDPSADTHSAGGKIHGVGKIGDFRLKLPSISKTVRDRPKVTMER